MLAPVTPIYTTSTDVLIKNNPVFHNISAPSGTRQLLLRRNFSLPKTYRGYAHFQPFSFGIGLFQTLTYTPITRSTYKSYVLLVCIMAISLSDGGIKTPALFTINRLLYRRYHLPSGYHHRRRHNHHHHHHHHRCRRVHHHHCRHDHHIQLIKVVVCRFLQV